MILTQRSKERLSEDDPIYKFVDYYECNEFELPLKTMTITEWYIAMEDNGVFNLKN